MITLTVRLQVRPEFADTFLAELQDMTDATRAHPGNLWYITSRNAEDACEFIITEGFVDAEAGAAHLATDYFRAGQAKMRPMLAGAPKMIYADLGAGRTGWDEPAGPQAN